MYPPRHSVLFAWLGVLLLATGPRTNAQVLTDPQLRAQQVVSGLAMPTAMAFLGSNDILVLEKDAGKVRRVTDGVLQSNAVLQLSVDTLEERGLLGIAVHPQFPATNWVYLYYSAPGSPPTNRIARFEWDGSSLTNELVLLELPAAFYDHNGGTMTFGSDGKLYAVIGDQGMTGLFQNLDTNTPPEITSSIVRLNDDGTVPNDNPFFALGGVCSRVFAYGVRNSFGLAVDPVSGALWDTENGPTSYDEVNRVDAGFNSGWKRIMGPVSRNAATTNDLVPLAGSHYADPEFSWLNTVAPTAIAFLNSTNLGAQYENDAFVGDFNTGTLYRFRPNGARDGFVFTDPNLSDLVADNASQLSEITIGTGFGAISDVKVGPDDRLYVLSISNGKIFVIEASPPTVDLAGAWDANGPIQACKGSGPSLQCKLKGKLVITCAGTTMAPASLVRFYLSDDAVLDGGDLQLGADAILKPIKAGKSKKVKLKAMLNGTSASGKYVIAFVDAGEAVNETDETNNVVVVGPLP